MCESDHAGWVVVICFTLRHKKTQTSNVSLKKWSGGRLLNTLFHLIRAAVMKYTNTAKVISRVQRFIHSSESTNIWATFTFKIMSSYFQWSDRQTASYCWKHQKSGNTTQMFRRWFELMIKHKDQFESVTHWLPSCQSDILLKFGCRKSSGWNSVEQSLDHFSFFELSWTCLWGRNQKRLKQIPVRVCWGVLLYRPCFVWLYICI